MPRCPACGLDKAFDDFPKNRSAANGRQTYCKPCHSQKMRMYKKRKYGGEKNFLLRLRYGVDEELVTDMLRSQMGLCAICRSRPAIHVDHHHSTGHIRGLLCLKCNGGLGKADDEPVVLVSAMQYLERHGAS